MIRNLLCLFLLINVSIISAQDISMMYGDVSVDNDYGIGTFKIKDTIVNNTASAIDLVWVRTINSLPQGTEGWSSAICDINTCWSSSTFTKEFTLPANGKGELSPTIALKDFTLPAGTPVMEGIGTVEIHVYAVGDSANTNLTTTYTATVGDPNGIEILRDQNTISVFPNPATQYFKLNDANQEVKVINVYNIVGRLVNSFEVTNTQQSFSVIDLPKGMYMLQMLSEKNEILHTTRLNRVTP